MMTAAQRHNARQDRIWERALAYKANEERAMMTKGRLRFFRTDQEPGDPRRAYVHIGYERVGDGVTTTGDVGSVHPQFAPAIAQVPAMVEICRKLDAYAQGELESGGPVHYPGLVEQARAILRAVEGK